MLSLWGQVYDVAMNQPAHQAPELADTRARIVMAGMRLFRKKGFHGTGLADVLALAQAPKGSLYHHFPLGKEAIGVAVVEALADSMLRMLQSSRARSTGALVGQFGAQLAEVMARTDHELCSLFSSFVAERRSNPALGQAVVAAYELLAKFLEARLGQEGLSARQAQELAQTVVMLLEGGATLAQAQQSTAPFKLAVKQAQRLCASDLRPRF